MYVFAQDTEKSNWWTWSGKSYKTVNPSSQIKLELPRPSYPSGGQREGRGEEMSKCIGGAQEIDVSKHLSSQHGMDVDDGGELWGPVVRDPGTGLRCLPLPAKLGFRIGCGRVQKVP